MTIYVVGGLYVVTSRTIKWYLDYMCCNITIGLRPASNVMKIAYKDEQWKCDMILELTYYMYGLSNCDSSCQ